LCKGGVTSADGLKAWFISNRADVEQVLANAGAGDMGDAILSAIESGDVQETTITAGQEFLWMGRRKKGLPIAQPNVRYMGKKEEKAFKLAVTQNCETHELLIPAICCNLSLVSSSPVPPPGMPSLDVIPPDSCGGGVVDIRAVGDSGSTLDIVLVGPDGQERQLTEADLNGNLNIQGAGGYTIKAGTTNACGTSKDRSVAKFEVEACPVSKAPEPEPEPEPKIGILPFAAAFIGTQHRSRDICSCIDDLDEGIVGARVGAMYPLTETLSAFGQLGAAFDEEDSAYSLLQADVGLETRIGQSGFLGGGVGIWDLNNSKYRDPTVFLHGGVDTPWKSALTGLRLMYGK